MSSGGSRSPSKRGSLDPKSDERSFPLFDDPLLYELFAAIATSVVRGTPSELSRYVGVPVAEVKRRLDVLERLELIEPVAEADAARETPYRTIRDALITDDEFAAFSPVQRRQVFNTLLRNIDGRMWTAFERGGFDRHDTHVSWTPLDLDRQGYDEMVRVALETVERARDIQAEVVERRAAGTSDGGACTDLMVLHFSRDGAGQPTTRADSVVRLQEQIYEACEEFADAVTAPALDTSRLAARARELAGLLERLGVATR